MSQPVNQRISAWKIPVDQIQILPGLNIREEYNFHPDFSKMTPEQIAWYIEDLSDLDSIFERGVTEPLKGFKKGAVYVPTNGHRRFFWLMLQRFLSPEALHLPVVPWLNESGTANEADYVITQFTSNASRGLSQLDQARGIQRLLNYNMSKEEIARNIGMKISTIEDRLRLLKAHPDVQQLVKEGEISPSNVAETVKKDGREEATAIISRAKEIRDEELASEPDPTPEPEVVESEPTAPAPKRVKKGIKKEKPRITDRHIQKARDEIRAKKDPDGTEQLRTELIDRIVGTDYTEVPTSTLEAICKLLP